MDCKACGSKIPNWARVGERTVNLSNRRYCLVCSPYGERAKNSKTGCLKTCSRCHNPQPTSQFYPRRKRVGIGNLSPWCRKCYRDDAATRQRAFKERCIQYKGGACLKCGYNRYSGAMDFHHRDPTKKDFGLSRRRSCTWTEEIQRELDKCDLLCANCHRETHAELGLPVPHAPVV